MHRLCCSTVKSCTHIRSGRRLDFIDYLRHTKHTTGVDAASYTIVLLSEKYKVIYSK